MPSTHADEVLNGLYLRGHVAAAIHQIDLHSTLGVLQELVVALCVLDKHLVGQVHHATADGDLLLDSGAALLDVVSRLGLAAGGER